MFEENISVMKSSYLLEATKRSPKINFESKGNFCISGNSYIEDPENFYRPAVMWLNDFLEQNKNEINFTINLEYVNSSSSKIVLNMLYAIIDSGVKLNVTWEYEEEDFDILELGESLQTLTQLNFNFKSIS